MNPREFQLVEGTSNKFWRIELEGAKYTVCFGRRGTAGQAQTKEFSSEAEAKQASEKLIAEKLKKGYVEVGGGPAAPASVPAPALAPVARAKPPKPAPSEPAVPAAPAVAAVEPAPPPPVPVPAAPAALSAERSLGLAPEDWAWATWRPRTIRPKPAPKPFVLADCLARLQRVTCNAHGWDWRWEKAGIAPVMVPAEAEFWFLAMTSASAKTTPEEIAEHLANNTFTGRVPLDLVPHRLKECSRRIGEEFVAVLAGLYSLDDLISLVTGEFKLADPAFGRWHNPLLSELAALFTTGFAEYVLPYLTDEELARLRKRLGGALDPARRPTDYYQAWPAEFYFAAQVGCHEGLQRAVASIPDDCYGKDDWNDYYHKPQRLIFGLGEPRLVEAEMRRLKLKLKTPDYVRAWLAHTEYGALDYVRDSIQAETNRDRALELFKVFALVKAPEAAAPMLELKLASKGPGAAAAWLDENPLPAIAGLVPMAATRGRLGEAALEYLRACKRKGLAEPIQAALAHASPECAEVVRRQVLEFTEKVYPELDHQSTPAWLAAAVAEARQGRAPVIPSWADPAALPPLLVGDRKLNAAQSAAVLGTLQRSTLDQPQPLIAALRQQADRAALDVFAWALFNRWLEQGAPSKDKWALLAVGLFGGDACALKLTPLIRAWPGESQHQRAVVGLECLRAIGSDTALMQLNGVAQKLKFKGLKTRAMELMEAIASDRKMSRAELEDRIVPDCGLDESGSRVFDFGPRQFRFVLGPEMKPMVREAQGKLRPDLPSPNSSDTAALAEAAVAEWKLMKKQIKEVAKIQAERLEQAMVTGRRWPVAEFETLVARHPLMSHLVRLLLWAGYDSAGALRTTFRVAEDGTYADQQDDTCQLGTLTRVGIVHPLHLSAEQKAAWGELFSDYEIVPPFQQLGRPCYALEGNEAVASELTRFKASAIPATALVGTLERLAWVRGIPQDAGIFFEHTKPFYGAKVTAVVQYEPGVPVGYMDGWEDQKISTCIFLPGIYRPESYPDHKQRLRLGEVDPVVLSEVLKDLTTLAAMAK